MERQTVIENPILNSPFLEPSRHYRFDEDGITNDIIEGRRISSYFVPRESLLSLNADVLLLRICPLTSQEARWNRS